MIPEITAIATGDAHACALTSEGGVKCWGNNRFGQFGNGSTTSSSRPVDVVGLTSGTIAIAAGGSNTCVLTSEGGVKCWGDNIGGQLGDGTTTDSLRPVDVLGLSNGVSAIAVGGSFACALTVEGGVKCWGQNHRGQLGDGTATDSGIPVDVSGLADGVIAVSTGEIHTCAVMSNGGVKCWGNNIGGELGDGTTTIRFSPVDVAGLAREVTAVGAGSNWTCVLTGGFGVECWGQNDVGQLGNGSATESLTPVGVSGLASGVEALGIGGTPCAITDIGGVKCWGRNEGGELGDGSETDALTPVDVWGLASGVEAVAVSGGGNFGCALTTQGGVKCWGRNNEGQLGNGTTIGSLTPVDTDFATTASGTP